MKSLFVLSEKYWKEQPTLEREIFAGRRFREYVDFAWIFFSWITQYEEVGQDLFSRIEKKEKIYVNVSNRIGLTCLKKTWRIEGRIKSGIFPPIFVYETSK